MAEEKQFSEVIQILLDPNQPLQAEYLRYFSDIDNKDLKLVSDKWQDIVPNRRIKIMEALEEMHENDTLVSFDDFSIFAMEDGNEEVRASAIRLLWESENYRITPKFINLLNSDESALVRATAASILGAFVYLGEIDKIPKDILTSIEESLISAAKNDASENVQRKAIEAMGYSSRKEAGQLIKKAFHQDAVEWKVSALSAMGKSCDPSWKATILPLIESPILALQNEAIRAAGELGLSEAREYLFNLLIEDEDLDEELIFTTIWALSEIGGQNVKELLIKMQDDAEDNDEEEFVDFIENALENLDLTEGLQDFEMFAFGNPDDNDLDELISSENSLKE
jgi:HEAT repeat protein